MRGFRHTLLAAAAAPLMLAGVLPLDSALEARWPLAAVWSYPVGDPPGRGPALDSGESRFEVTRGVSATHLGVDLSNRRQGDPVRAAAAGLVVAAGEGHAGDGFGQRVVIAHRGADQRTIYSVYAHLLAGSLSVHPGEIVARGSALGCVGMTGRASAAHLHFEVRVPGRLDERWEHAEAVDPIAFIEARLAPGDGAPGANSVLLAWAVESRLLGAGVPGQRTATRGEWWCALRSAIDPASASPDANGESALERLHALGVVPRHPERDADQPPTWREIAQELSQASHRTVQVAPSPMPHDSLRSRQLEQFEVDALGRPSRLAHLDRVPPSREEVALLLAGLAAVQHAAPPAHPDGAHP